MSGLYLVAPLRILSPFTWGVPGEYEAGVAPYVKAFYEDSTHRPDVMIVVNDAFLPPVGSVQYTMLETYYEPWLTLDEQITLWRRTR